MAPKKKTSSMVWVVKSKQSANTATEKETPSTMLDCSLLPDCVSKLQLSPSPSAKMTQPATLSDWSQLPEELLHIIISEKLEDCFDVIHARSVCCPWRSTFPFPSWLLRTSYSLPSFAKFPHKSRGLCTLEKFPMFVFRVRAPADVALPSEFYVGGVGQDKPEDDHMELSSSIQCSVKLKIGESDPTMMNILDYQVLPLGQQYRMVGWDPDPCKSKYRGVAFLPLNKEGRGGGEFVVLLNYSNTLLVLRSAEMRWMRLERASDSSCKSLVASCNFSWRRRLRYRSLFADTDPTDALAASEVEQVSVHNW